MLLDLAQGRSTGEAFQAFQQFQHSGGQQLQQQSGGRQQSRNGSSGADCRGAVPGIDDSAAPRSGVGTSSRVDYRI